VFMVLLECLVGMIKAVFKMILVEITQSYIRMKTHDLLNILI
jgi:hypothetical protein